MRSSEDGAELGLCPEVRGNRDWASAPSTSAPPRQPPGEAGPTHTREETDACLMWRVRDASALPVTMARGPEPSAPRGPRHRREDVQKHAGRSESGAVAAKGHVSPPSLSLCLPPHVCQRHRHEREDGAVGAVTSDMLTGARAGGPRLARPLLLLQTHLTDVPDGNLFQKSVL